MICSDFHPFNKISDALNFRQPARSYFYTSVFDGEMAHARFYGVEIRKQFPKCPYRKYTVSEIINSIIANGSTLQRFDEQPSWENEMLQENLLRSRSRSEWQRLCKLHMAVTDRIKK